jgi:hypothetical protein
MVRVLVGLVAWSVACGLALSDPCQPPLALYDVNIWLRPANATPSSARKRFPIGAWSSPIGVYG